MRVRMLVSLTGFRNGQPWPPRGEFVELPEAEAADMVNSGHAAPAEPVQAGVCPRCGYVDREGG